MVDSPDEIRRTDTSHHLRSAVVQREERLRLVASHRGFSFMYSVTVCSHRTRSRVSPVGPAGRVFPSSMRMEAFSGKSSLCITTAFLPNPFGLAFAAVNRWWSDHVNGSTFLKSRYDYSRTWCRCMHFSTFRRNVCCQSCEKLVYNWNNDTREFRGIVRGVFRGCVSRSIHVDVFFFESNCSCQSS